MPGRPPTYHSTDEWPVSVSVRIPRVLYVQAQQRVQQRRLTLTEALLEGLQLWLETPTDPREVFLSDESNTIMQELRKELLSELREEVRKDVPALVASVIRAELATLKSPVPPLPTHDIPAVKNDILHDNGNTVLQETPQSVAPHTAIPPYDTTKYVLGQLCKAGHAFQGTVQSLLRLKQRDCPACENERKRQQRRAKAREAGLL